MYQRAYVAIPSISTTHQSARTVRIHALYLVSRSFCGKTLVPAASRMYKTRDLGDSSKHRVRRRQPIESPAKLLGNPGENLNPKRGNHRQRNQCGVENHDGGLAPRVLSIALEAR